jgi:hypothetical protein
MCYKHRLLFFCFSTLTLALSGQDLASMQKVADDWEYTCKNELRIDPGTLSWIIFYDSTRAWHINPEVSLLPAHRKLTTSISFSGVDYPLYQVEHKDKLWIPEQDPIDVKTRAVAAMPVSGNTKSFFIAPVTAYFRTLAPTDQSPFLDLLLSGLNMHELTHTRQLPFTIKQMLTVQKESKLPESIDDNSIQKTFENNEHYKALFFKEKTHLWNAVMANNLDSCKHELKTALRLVRERQHKFFDKQNEGYKKLDDIFLALEGSAMWAQYKATLRYAPRGQSPEQTLYFLMQHCDSWSQEEGLALFLIIDKLIPGWQKHFFDKELPSPIAIIEKYILEN